MKIYHNSRCKKSRAGLQYLQEKGIDFDIREYLKEALTVDELKEILLKMNVEPQELVRTQEVYFKSDLKGRKFSKEEWITIIIENPKLLKRPIVVTEKRAVWGDPAEEIEKVL